ncbi:MAG: VTT domain-containing protein [Bifidobacteriaceae bacterium]|jgi:membrane-associated protein|nr:VTT domain-containing protein [Bifidobacteriaceae bacterium]
MIPGVNLTELIRNAGPLIYLLPLIIFSETGLMIGFFLPGDSLLFTAGALIGLKLVDVNIIVLCLLFFLCAICGNTTGYLIGRHFGRKLFTKKDSKVFKQKYILQAEGFYEQHGGIAVILAQFMPIIRTFCPIVTGISKMNYKKFIAFNIIGAFFWTICITLIGYFIFGAFGNVINPEDIDKFLLPIIILIVFISVLPAGLKVIHHKILQKK